MIIALFFGIFVASVQSFIPTAFAKNWGTKLLQFAIVLLGFRLSFADLSTALYHGLPLTAGSLVFIFVLSALLSRVRYFSALTSPLSDLIAAGTAICGGSAIAALSPIVRAKAEEISASLAVVFLLNSIAAVVFPILGIWLGFQADQFGLWAAIAIHDTSSVIAASSVFAPGALEVATATKLTRTLWIVPVGLWFQWRYSKKNGGATAGIRVPAFIPGFVAAVLGGEWLRGSSVGDLVVPFMKHISMIGFVGGLFFIGAASPVQKLRLIGLRAIAFASVLWVANGVLSAAVITLQK